MGIAVTANRIGAVVTRRYILDSNAVSDLIYHRRNVRDRAAKAKARGSKIGTCPPVIGELFAGAYRSETRDRNLAELSQGLRGLTIWPYHTDETMRFGLLWAELRRIGRPMQIVDVQLAAVAQTLSDCTVVSSDTDLLAIPGLAVESWAQ